jgi:CheY-like chemotaxis protein
VRRKLLLADASTAIQRVVALTFAGQDVQVVAVSDGEQAIQRIPAERPDVVLANIGTAKRSGYDVAAFVKAHPDLSHVPVLLLASAFEPVDEERVRQVRSAGVLVKPFEPQQVLARVRDLVPDQASPSPGAVVQAGAAGAPGRTEPLATSGVRVPASRAPDPESRLAGPEPGVASLVSGSPALESRAADPESRIPHPGPPVPDPGSPVPDPQSPIPNASAGGTGSLDDYFDRLDAALTSRSANRLVPPAPPPTVGEDDDGRNEMVPSIDDVLGPEPVSARTGTATGLEAGTANPTESRVPNPLSPSPSQIPITDELVEQIVERVIERLRSRPKA